MSENKEKVQGVENKLIAGVTKEVKSEIQGEPEGTKSEINFGCQDQQDVKNKMLEKNELIRNERKFDITSLQRPKTRAIGRADFSVVNTIDNGQRVKLSKELCRSLDISVAKDTIEIAFALDGVVLARDLSGIGAKFNLSKSYIYSKALVGEITERFELDFVGITTRSFSNPEYQVLDSGYKVAIIKM